MRGEQGQPVRGQCNVDVVMRICQCVTGRALNNAQVSLILVT